MQRNHAKARYTEAEVWPTARAGPIERDLDGATVEITFHGLQALSSLLANHVSIALCQPEDQPIIPQGVRDGGIRTRTDGPRFDLRRLMPTPA